MRKLILRSFQSPGDIVMLTAAVRDLHRACPGQFATDVRTTAEPIWDNNPHITHLDEGHPDVELIDMHYPLIHQSNQRPYHFIHGFAQYLEERLDVRIPVTEFRGDIYLSSEERSSRPSGLPAVPENYWIIVAGGKHDFTAKWWDPASFQKVVDLLQGHVHFVQCGEAGHWHPQLSGVTDLLGKTSTRQFIQVVHHADGILSPVTLAMHLAAAVPTKSGRPQHRAAVIVAGGREPGHWEAYPHHQYIHTIGALPCCADGGCWKSRCQLVGDGDPKDRSGLCSRPVQVTPELRIPQCMHLITPEDVVRRIKLYYEGGMSNQAPSAAAAQPPPHAPPAAAMLGTPPASTTSVSFYHGLGDCANFARLIPLYIRRGHQISVECTPDKAILFRAAGAHVVSRAQHTHAWAHAPHEVPAGHGPDWLGSKPGWNISEPPLPSIGKNRELWTEYYRTQVRVSPLIPKQDVKTVCRWLDGLLRPVVLLHTKGNTGQQQKSLPDHIAVEFYKELLDRFDGTLVLLDWDDRVPRLSSWRVRHLSDLTSDCSTEQMFALMDQADLLIGIDSGPLHACALTDTPTVGLWMPKHYPARYALPRRHQLNVVLADHTHLWNRYHRIAWNIVEHAGTEFDPAILSDFCAAMLTSPRYLSREHLASDVQMQQWIRRWCRCSVGNSLSQHADRNHSFDVLFRELSKRFSNPTIMETGTMRAEEDWSGTGFFTYLAGAYAFRAGGVVHSVDIDAGKCDFARTWCSPFGDSVQGHASDSVAYLSDFPDPIDVLYLDSLDTYEPGHAEHALKEAQAALPRLHDRSIIIFDDSPWTAGTVAGKGALAVPWLLNQGWHIVYAGYQVILSKTTP